MSRTLDRPTAILGLALALTSAGAAKAADARLKLVSFTQSAAAGLPVKAPLDEFRAVSRARVAVPAAWRTLPATAGQARFESARSPGCHYRVTFSVTTRVAAAGDAQRYVTAALPAASAPYLLDSGVHDSRAFRVVRQKTGSGVRIDGLWAAILTRRADIAPSGQVVWSEIRASARSRAGDECHAGTYREVLGPQLGDALAIARSTLRFVRP
ncbi:MAG: hypothetical protein QOJ89_1684 [bacterium]|jgi:hypothetical protein